MFQFISYSIFHVFSNCEIPRRSTLLLKPMKRLNILRYIFHTFLRFNINSRGQLRLNTFRVITFYAKKKTFSCLLNFSDIVGFDIAYFFFSYSVVMHSFLAEH